MAFKLRVFVSIDSDVIYSRVHRFSPIGGDIKKKQKKKRMKGKVSPTMSAANWSTMRKNGVCTCVEEGQVCVRECSLRSFSLCVRHRRKT